MALAYSGKSVNEMAAHLEVTRASASRWLSGTHSVKGLVLREWAEQTGVNEQWLRTGEVPAEAIVKESCATRDSNPQPSDWWSSLEQRFEVEGFRRTLLGLAFRLGDRSMEFFEFLDVLGEDAGPDPLSSFAGLASIRRQPKIDAKTPIPAGVE